MRLVITLLIGIVIGGIGSIFGFDIVNQELMARLNLSTEIIQRLDEAQAEAKNIYEQAKVRLTGTIHALEQDNSILISTNNRLTNENEELTAQLQEAQLKIVQYEKKALDLLKHSRDK